MKIFVFLFKNQKSNNEQQVCAWLAILTKTVKIKFFFHTDLFCSTLLLALNKELKFKSDIFTGKNWQKKNCELQRLHMHTYMRFDEQNSDEY